MGTRAAELEFLDIVEITAPANPPANTIRVYIDSADGKLKAKNSAGVVRVVDVDSVFGRTGAVVAASADYTAAQVTNAFDKLTNNIVGAKYVDVANLATPANPAAGTRRLFVDSGTGKISVRTSAGATTSLEESGGAAPVDSVFTRTGAVVAVSGDYSANEVTNAFDKIANNDMGAKYFDLGNLATPANPAASKRRVFVDSVSGKLSVRTNAGATVSLEEQGGVAVYRLRNPTEITRAFASTGSTDLINVTEAGKLLGIMLRVSGTITGSPIMRLEVVVDGGTQENIVVYNASTLWVDFFKYLSNALSGQAMAGSVIDDSFLLLLDTTFETSLIVRANVTTSGGGTVKAWGIRATKQ